MTVATTILDTLLSALANSRQTIDEINTACSTKGLPPAFQDSDTSPVGIVGNPGYRFEGFGVIVVRPFPPKFALSFWVHYRPGSTQHVALGRFTVPISALNALKFRSLPNPN
ncbi:MAG: hypothetical protein KME10_29725 [Plectolyngbya sp. WJT66-NPBG17]|jgi:hypothetical protein|nr:hypothetical protein [Plectolyngbya sp. WJT66-NPBG17]